MEQSNGTKTAKMVLPRIPSMQDARLYRLSEPLRGHEYVVVSAVVAYITGPETYIFGADARGDITEWCELDGSFRGGLDHAQALGNAGYEVTS